MKEDAIPPPSDARRGGEEGQQQQQEGGVLVDLHVMYVDNAKLISFRSKSLNFPSG